MNVEVDSSPVTLQRRNHLVGQDLDGSHAGDPAKLRLDSEFTTNGC